MNKLDNVDMTLGGYKISYPKLDKKLEDCNKNTYNVLLYSIIADEIAKGFYPKKIGKACKSGTSIRFEKIKMTEEILNRIEEINKTIDGLKKLSKKDIKELKEILECNKK